MTYGSEIVTGVVLGTVLGWLSKRTDTGIVCGIRKTQDVRILDVIALGPFMVYMSTTAQAPKIARFVLAFSGAATISYNGRNYLELRRNDHARES